MCDFTFRHYKYILNKALKRGFKFSFFDEFYAGKALILRHDIDYMPEWSLRFSEIELELGVRSTYFFQVCAKTYNLREKNIHSIVNKLKSSGHEIGLHFDVGWTGKMDCLGDKKLFEAITSIKPCNIISFHNTSLYNVLGKSIPNLHHTYEKKYFGEFRYISDSRGWREDCPCKLLDKYEKIQLLTHPYIWSDKKYTFPEQVANNIKFRAKELYDYYVKHHPDCSKNKILIKKYINKKGL